MNIPKTAIIGASGMIGRAFLAQFRRYYPDCVGTTRKNPAEGMNRTKCIRQQIITIGLQALRFDVVFRGLLKRAQICTKS